MDADVRGWYNKSGDKCLKPLHPLERSQKKRRAGKMFLLTLRINVVNPIRRLNVDLTEGMLRELDRRAATMNISRQAVIKTLLARAISEEGSTKKVR